jgi:hypothetical protein
MSEEPHTWIIDAIEEDVASVEEDGESMRHVPLWLLPPGVREGAVLAVVRSLSRDGSVHLTVTIDQAAMARQRSGASRKDRPLDPADPGGDIVL